MHLGCLCMKDTSHKNEHLERRLPWAAPRDLAVQFFASSVLAHGMWREEEREVDFKLRPANFG